MRQVARNKKKNWDKITDNKEHLTEIAPTNVKAIDNLNLKWQGSVYSL